MLGSSSVAAQLAVSQEGLSSMSESGWGDIDWIDVAQGRDQWKDFVNMVMNLGIP
jgi:hypothetical protein